MASIDFAKRPGFSNPNKRKFLTDRRFIPRVKEFVQVCQHEPTFEEILDYLQDSFPEYGRRKRGALRSQLNKALNNTDILCSTRFDRTTNLENNYLAKRQKSCERRDDDATDESDDMLDEEEELLEYKDSNLINNSMQSLYKTVANNKTAAGRPAPVIDLTSSADKDTCGESKNSPAVQSPRQINIHLNAKQSPGRTEILRNSLQSQAKPSAESNSMQSTGQTTTPVKNTNAVAQGGIQSSPHHHGSQGTTKIFSPTRRQIVPLSPRQQGIQVFSKNNHGKDDSNRTKITMHPSDGDTKNIDKFYSDDKRPINSNPNENTKFKILADEKPTLKSVVVATNGTALMNNVEKVDNIGNHNSVVKPVIVNRHIASVVDDKSLVLLSEDEKSVVSSRPSTPTPGTKGKVTRKKEVPKENRKRFETTVSNKSFKDVGGYESCIQEVSKLLLHLKHPEVFLTIGIKPPRGFLLHGPPGCGKTLLANAIAGEMGIPFYKIAAPEVVSGISGDSEQRIRSLFAEAVAVAPSILFIDEIDSITPKRETAGKEMERRVVTQLLSCMDELDEAASHVLVIGATNRPDSIDPALRRAGRFDREIAMGIPDRPARKTILEVICRNLRLSPEFDFEKIALKTPGFVGADMQALAREAAMCAVKSAFESLENMETSSSLMDFTVTRPTAMTCGETTSFKESNTTAWLRDQAPLSEAELSKLYISTDDFECALPHVQPSAKREGFATVPDVTWEDVGALEDIREELTMAIMAPVENPEEFESLGLTTPPGILLCGPPGCGKTLLAKAVANEAGVNFISVKGPELLNMYVGESEKAVRQVFQRARSSCPCVIFFDEIDALCPQRSQTGDSNVTSRVVNQLLTEMDGLESRKNVFIMGATNRPDILDSAILRPGRMDKQLYVGLPNCADRAKILRTITKNGTKPTLSKGVNIDKLAADSRSEGFSGADLSALVREASVMALKEFMRKRKDGFIEEEEVEEEEDGKEEGDGKEEEDGKETEAVCVKEEEGILSDILPNEEGALPHFARSYLYNTIIVSCPSDAGSDSTASPQVVENQAAGNQSEAEIDATLQNTDDKAANTNAVNDMLVSSPEKHALIDESNASLASPYKGHLNNYLNRNDKALSQPLGFKEIPQCIDINDDEVISAESITKGTEAEIELLHTPIGLSPQTPIDLSSQSPIDLSSQSSQTPIDLSSKTPIDLLPQVPIDLPLQTPIDLSSQSPIDLSSQSSQTPIDLTSQTPIDLSSQTPIDLSSQTLIDLSSQTPIDKSLHTRMDLASQAQMDVSMDVSSGIPMELSSKAPIDLSEPSSVASTDFQVARVADNKSELINVSCEMTTEDVQIAIPTYLNVEEQLPVNDVENERNDMVADNISNSALVTTIIPKENIVTVPPTDSQSQCRKIVVTKKHFELAFKNVKPSVSERDRLWYDRMKSKNNMR